MKGFPLKISHLNGAGRAHYAQYKKMTGRGLADWFKSVGNKIKDFVTQKAWPAIKSAAQWAKDNKVLSRGLALIPDPRAQLASKAADVAGLGRQAGGQAGGRRRRVKLN